MIHQNQKVSNDVFYHSMLKISPLITHHFLKIIKRSYSLQDIKISIFINNEKIYLIANL